MGQVKEKKLLLWEEFERLTEYTDKEGIQALIFHWFSMNDLEEFIEFIKHERK